jgi:hypothetical protein
VPFAGNTHDLQNRQGEVQRWFMETVGKVNPRVGQGITTQGFYVIGADGSAYAFNNNRSVERVLNFMDRGMAGFRSNPPKAAAIPEPKEVVIRPPEGTSVIRIYSRIKPCPSGCDPGNENLQRDHFWVLPEEVRALAGGIVSVSLKIRLCRFALVDAVRGEPDFWTLGEVRIGAFSIKNGRTLTGSFKMSTADGKRGLEGTLEAELRVEGARIAAFKGFAETTAWGQGTWTPGAPEGKFPLKFAFVLAPNGIDAVAPQAAMFGKEYLGLP